MMKGDVIVIFDGCDLATASDAVFAGAWKAKTLETENIWDEKPTKITRCNKNCKYGAILVLINDLNNLQPCVFALIRSVSEIILFLSMRTENGKIIKLFVFRYHRDRCSNTNNSG